MSTTFHHFSVSLGILSFYTTCQPRGSHQVIWMSHVLHKALATRKLGTSTVKTDSPQPSRPRYVIWRGGPDSMVNSYFSLFGTSRLQEPGLPPPNSRIPDTRNGQISATCPPTWMVPMSLGLLGCSRVHSPA
jgi:hypothetical protein